MRPLLGLRLEEAKKQLGGSVTVVYTCAQSPRFTADCERVLRVRKRNGKTEITAGRCKCGV